MSSFESTGEEKGEKKQRLEENEEEENEEVKGGEEEVKGEEEEEEVVYTRHEMNWNDVSSSEDYSRFRRVVISTDADPEMTDLQHLPDLSPLSHVWDLLILINNTSRRGYDSLVNLIKGGDGFDQPNFFIATNMSKKNPSVRVPTVEIKALRCLDQFTNLTSLTIHVSRFFYPSFIRSFDQTIENEIK